MNTTGTDLAHDWHLIKWADMESATIHLPPLTKRNMSDLVYLAERLGVTPEQYAKQLIEDALALHRSPEKTSFAEIMRPVREEAGDVDEDEIVKLVDQARTRHHEAIKEPKKR